MVEEERRSCGLFLRVSAMQTRKLSPLPWPEVEGSGAHSEMGWCQSQNWHRGGVETVGLSGGGWRGRVPTTL